MPGLSADSSSSRVTSLLEEDYPSLEDLYREFHSHPELSGQEKWTSGRLAIELETAGCTVTQGIGGFGVVALMQNGVGPVLMLRADMDALPIREETGLPYASTIKMNDSQGRTVDVMHACGHDLHMTALVGAARVLGALKDRWKGTLILIRATIRRDGLRGSQDD
jgi:amidohydrolase